MHEGHGTTDYNESMSDRRAIRYLAVLLVVATGLLVYPMMVIQPFRHQGETELKVALWIIRWRVYFEVLAVVGALAIFASRRRWLAGLLALLVCVAAGLTRLNVFEIMFHRYDKPAFAAVSEAKVDGDDKVLAIVVGGAARAYPIRNIAYHHIINDEVGGRAVVATY